VNEDDPAAALLMSLPDRDPAKAVGLLEAAVAAGQVKDSTEVRLHKARELVQAELSPESLLVQVEQSDPWDWRVQWYRSLFQLQLGAAEAAAEGFSRVWTELPGETAPKLAVALAAEMAGEHRRAAEVYDLVISVDSSYVSAAFGLARCHAGLGDSAAVVEALGRVPPSSVAHYDAQVAIARALVAGGPAGPPSVAELQTAAATIERLQLDAAERAALSADVYERALAGVRDGTIPSDSTLLLGHPLNERSLQVGLEKTYRTQARLAGSTPERVRLVDLANAVRPRSLF
jgi:serine/threonine-protein kinase PknG